MIAEIVLSVAILLLPAISFVLYYFMGRNKVALAAGGGLIVTATLLLRMYSGVTGAFYVDSVTWVFLVMVASVHLLSTLYSTEYFRGTRLGIREETFYLLLNLFTTSMFFSLLVNNYGLMWVGIEATTITSSLLLIAEKTESSLEATWRYLVIVSAGVTFAFFSIILIYYSLGTLEMSAILSQGPHSSPVLALAVVIALMGFGTKVGVFPVHTWLPDAHSESPAPVSAMFSGVLLPTALYVLYRVYEIDPITSIYVWAAVISVAAASIFLGYQTRYKRMFAYSTMENMNLALIGFAVGGSAGILGALLLLVSHSFGKAGAFYTSGSIFKSLGVKKITEVSGMWKSMPSSSGSLLLSSMAVTGAPPFGTFFGEFLIFYSMLSHHLYVQLGIVAFFVVTAFISVNFNVSRMLFKGESDNVAEGRMMPFLSMISSLIPLVIGVVFMVVYLEVL